MSRFSLLYLKYLWRRYIVRVDPLDFGYGGTVDCHPIIADWPGIQQAPDSYAPIDDKAIYRSQHRRHLLTWN